MTWVDFASNAALGLTLLILAATLTRRARLKETPAVLGAIASSFCIGVLALGRSFESFGLERENSLFISLRIIAIAGIIQFAWHYKDVRYVRRNA